MSSSRPYQWYHSEADPIWPDGTIKDKTLQRSSQEVGVKAALGGRHRPRRDSGGKERLQPRGGAAVCLNRLQAGQKGGLQHQQQLEELDTVMVEHDMAGGF